jgi:hypothetical protein
MRAREAKAAKRIEIIVAKRYVSRDKTRWVYLGE